MIAARQSLAKTYTGSGRASSGNPSQSSPKPSTSASRPSSFRSDTAAAPSTLRRGSTNPAQRGNHSRRDVSDGDSAGDSGSDSDDMEPTGFEAIEAEERRSAAIARREDLAAEREESAHRRAKAERRRGLQRGVRA